MISNILIPEIEELIDSQEISTLHSFLFDLNPDEIAELIQELPFKDQNVIFRQVTKGKTVPVFQHLTLPSQKNLVRSLTLEHAIDVFQEMAPDNRTALLEDLPGAVIAQIVRCLSSEEREVASTLLNYPKDSIGRLMTPDYIAVKEDWTVGEVLEYVRKNGCDSETMSVVYVVDENGRLIDNIRMREFLLSPLEKKTSEIWNLRPHALSVVDDQEAAIKAFKKYRLFALPVVDTEDHLLGIVTMDDVLPVVEEEVTEDIQKFGGIEVLEKPYLTVPLSLMIQKRIRWLIFLFLGEMLTATAMGFFENEIARAVVLALFVPLIISSGGNSGSQAATLIVRAMALGEITLSDWWVVMKREMISGFSLGCTLGAIGFLRIALWSVFTNLYGPHWMIVATTVAVALIGVVMWGNLAGSMLPFVLKKIGADPATSSAPFVATFVDVTGLLIYFSVATFILL